MTKPRSIERGFLRCPASVAVAPGPDEVEDSTFLGLDQAGVDRRREARIVQLDGDVIAAGVRGLLPGGAKLRRRREDAIVGGRVRFRPRRGRT